MDSIERRADDCAPLTEAVALGEVELVAHSRGQYPGLPLPDGKLPGLRTIGYWDATGPQSWGLPMHRNEGIEICYILSGETPFATDGGQCTLSAGDMTVTRPWQRHCLGDPMIRPCKLFWFILDVETVGKRSTWEFPSWVGPDMAARKALLNVFRKNPRCYLAGAGKPLKDFMNRSCTTLGEREWSVMSSAHVANIINTLLLFVSEHLASDIEASSADPQGFDQTIRQFFSGLEASAEKAGRAWSVGEMAYACRVGKSYLSAATRRIYNGTPAELLNRIRMEHARVLLVQKPPKSVTEIAFELGFNTSQYFANRFRREFGCTPREYRKKHSLEVSV